MCLTSYVSSSILIFILGNPNSLSWKFQWLEITPEKPYKFNFESNSYLSDYK